MIVYPKDSGIYAIGQDMDGFVSPKYIGTTNNIRNRMIEHRDDDEKNEELKAFMKDHIDDVVVRFKTVDDKTRRANLEHTIISQYGLRVLFNKIIPKGVLINNIILPFDD